MPNPSETRPDALTELVHILREQLHQKDERIAALEAMLADATRRGAEQQRLLAQLLSSNARTAVLDPADVEALGEAVVPAVTPTPAPEPAAPAAHAPPPAPAVVVPLAAIKPVAPVRGVDAPAVHFQVGGEIPSIGAKASQLASLVFAAAEQRDAAPAGADGGVPPAVAPLAALSTPAPPPEAAPAEEAPVPKARVRASGAENGHASVPGDDLITTARFDRDELRRGHRKLRATASERRWQRMLGFRSRDAEA